MQPPSDNAGEELEPKGDVMDEAEFTSGMGEWDGFTYTMKYFPCQPENVDEGDLVWSQTMGKVYVSYMLTGAFADLDSSGIKLEASRTALKVARSAKDKKDSLAPLCGQLFSTIRSGLTWWDILDAEDGKKLYIVFQKFDHVSWKSLFKNEPCGFNRTAFTWTHNGDPFKDEVKMRQILPADPLDSMEVPDDINWQLLCIGLDDFQDSEEVVVITLRFDPKELDRVNNFVPTEELFGTEVTEKEVVVHFRVYEHGEPFVAFHGVLDGACVPQLTTWDFLPHVKSSHPLISGYTPALQLVLTKHPASQGLWSQVFSSAKHASEVHAPSRSHQADWAAKAALKSQESDTQATAASQDNERLPSEANTDGARAEMILKFHELRKSGLSARQATQQSLAHIRAKFAKGEAWLAPSMGALTGGEQE